MYIWQDAQVNNSVSVKLLRGVPVRDPPWGGPPGGAPERPSPSSEGAGPRRGTVATAKHPTKILRFWSLSQRVS